MEKKLKNKMFKSGFTLGEVLITIGVIGIIAALTVPTLISNYQKHITVVRLKKIFNEFNGIFEEAKLEYGPMSKWGIIHGQDTDEMDTVYYKIIAPKLKVSKYCGYGAGNTATSCWAYGCNIDGTNCSAIPNFYANAASLEDGTDVAFLNLSDEDYHHYVIQIEIDINGKKGPNRWGKDRFIFEISDTTLYKLDAMGSNPQYPSNDPDRDACWNSSADAGSTIEAAGSGRHCSYTIVKDGWKIADDYPF